MKIAPQEIQVWFANPATFGSSLPSLTDLITPEELARAKSFLFEKGRNEFLTARCTLRLLLSQYFPGIAPSDFTFSFNEYGKPSLSYPVSSLQFNISHSQGQVVIAFAENRTIGIDIECIDLHRDIHGIAETNFSPPEQKQLSELSGVGQHERFFQLWTLKEAYIKARGIGLSLPLDKFAFSQIPDHIQLSCWAPIVDQNEDWHFELKQDRPGLVIALAAKKRATENLQVTFNDFEYLKTKTHAA